MRAPLTQLGRRRREPAQAPDPEGVSFQMMKGHEDGGNVHRT